MTICPFCLHHYWVWGRVIHMPGNFTPFCCTVIECGRTDPPYARQFVPFVTPLVCGLSDTYATHFTPFCYTIIECGMEWSICQAICPFCYTIIECGTEDRLIHMLEQFAPFVTPLLCVGGVIPLSLHRYWVWDRVIHMPGNLPLLLHRYWVWDRGQTDP